MVILKITQSGWVNYTGYIGQVYFTDNISEPVTEKLALQVAAAIGCERVTDEMGETTEPFGITVDMVKGRHLAYDASHEVAPVKVSEAELEAERARDKLKASKPAPEMFKTLEELEKVASEKGIDALRDIAKTWGVRDRSIPKLIKKILEAQAQHQAALAVNPEADSPAPVETAAEGETNDVVEEGAETSETAEGTDEDGVDLAEDEPSGDQE